MADLTKKSKYLALILRHNPAAGNLTLDPNGWAEVIDLMKKAEFTAREIETIVETDGKKRYEYNADRTKVRAVQGHSLKDVDVELEEAIPPGELYHGTKESVKMEIARLGLVPMSRQHVHLTDNLKTAEETAGRRAGESVILVVDSCQMQAKGFKFYRAKNGVWLTAAVPPEFIQPKINK